MGLIPQSGLSGDGENSWKGVGFVFPRLLALAAKRHG